MKIDKIVQFKLIKSDLCFHEPDSRYWFDTLTVDTFDNNIPKVEEVIYFHNQDLEWEGIPSVSEVKDRLDEYYIPCKSKTYLQNITLKRSIVILRHFLKCHNYNIHSKEKFIKGIKYTTYRIIPQTDGIVVPDKPKKVIVSFD